MPVPFRQLTTSPAGVAFIKRWEGCKLTAYLCSAGDHKVNKDD